MNEHLADFATKYADLIALKLPDQKLYFVGGVVRDIFLGRSHNDVDILVKGDTREIAKKFANQLGGAFFMLDEARNTARVVVNTQDDHLVYDFAQMQGDSIEADLRLRDFTINAMAVDFDQPENVIDPLGGQQDLAKKRLLLCSPTSFSRDPVRVIRAVRYSISCEVKIAPETLQALKVSIPGLKAVSGERKRDEIFKILETPKPALGLELMVRLGIMAELFGQRYLTSNCQFNTTAALNHLFEMIQGVKSGEANKDLFEASCNLRFGRFYPFLNHHYFVKNLSERNTQQLCLLASCLGSVSQPELADLLSVFLLSKEETNKITCMINEKSRLEKTLAKGEITKREKYLYFKEIGTVGIDLIFLHLAELLALPASEIPQSNWLVELQKCEALLTGWIEEQDVVNPVPLINGNDLMMNFDLTPGPKIGLLLEKMKEEQAAGNLRNRQEAMNWVEQQLPNLGFAEQ